MPTMLSPKDVIKKSYLKQKLTDKKVYALYLLEEEEINLIESAYNG